MDTLNVISKRERALFQSRREINKISRRLSVWLLARSQEGDIFLNVFFKTRKYPDKKVSAVGECISKEFIVVIFNENVSIITPHKALQCSLPNVPSVSCA